MSEAVELKLYSPLQIDIIDRYAPGRAIPFQAVGCDCQSEYTRIIMNAFRAIQAQEDARNAFTAMKQNWAEVCEKIVSLTRSVELILDRPYNVFTCRSGEKLNAEEVNFLKQYCRNQWDRGWGEGYAHCPREGPGLGLYIHFWQDTAAPLLTREEFDRARIMGWGRISVKKIIPDTFWTLIDQARISCDGNQKETVYWLTDHLLAMEPEQALNFHSIMHGYMELANKYGLWNAALIIQENDHYTGGFDDFRAWLIFQGRKTYLSVLKDPDSLADIPACGKESCWFAKLPYVADIAYERLTGRNAYHDIPPADYRKVVAELKKDIVYGPKIGYPHEWSEVEAYLPRLTARLLTPEELRACIRRGHLWNPDDPAIQKARAIAAPKKEKTRSGRKKGGETR